MSIDNAMDGVRSLTNAVTTGVNTVTRATADLGLANIAGQGKYWMDQLRPAIYRGVRFGVFGGESHFGRRNAVHEYPYRDTAWVEDLGRQARRVTMGGFLVGDDVIAQRDRMITACEAPGDGELTHPTLGRMTVSLIEFSSVERWDQGRVFELSFVFIEAGRRTFPTVATSTGDAVSAEAAAADAAVAGDFAAGVSDALKHGAAVVKQAASTAATWANQAQRLANDATNLYNMVGRLSGSNGRFFGGRSNATKSVATVAGLIAAGATARTQVVNAATALASIAGKLSA
jgi:prophage DNA circulation protein